VNEEGTSGQQYCSNINRGNDEGKNHDGFHYLTTTANDFAISPKGLRVDTILKKHHSTSHLGRNAGQSTASTTPNCHVTIRYSGRFIFLNLLNIGCTMHAKPASSPQCRSLILGPASHAPYIHSEAATYARFIPFYHRSLVGAERTSEESGKGAFVHDLVGWRLKWLQLRHW
jgi:hypothetical protein